MGGGPTVSGGMSKAEYDAALKEQRDYAEKADSAREAKLAEYEQNRLASEKDLINAQKNAELAKVIAQQDAEKMTADEAEAAANAASSGTSDTLSSNFYESLYKGAGSIPADQTSNMSTDQITAALKQYRTGM